MGMTNPRHLKALLLLVAVIGMASCGGGGGADPAPGTTPPPAAASFSFPVVATTTTPQGCAREDGKAGVSAVTYYKRINASDLDQVVLPCDSPSGQRVLRSQPGLVPTLLYVDAAGTVVAELRDSLGLVRSIFAMLPGSAQEIELAATASPSPPVIGFVGVFNNRVLYVALTTGHAVELRSVTISQTPTTTVVGGAFGAMQVHDRPVGGRVLFATVNAFSQFDTEYRSVRPDGTDPLVLRTVLGLGPNPSAVPFPLHVLGDREVIYSELVPITGPSIRMLAIDTPGSDLLIAQTSVVLDQKILTVPGTTDRFVFLGSRANVTEPVLTEVTAQRGNLGIKTLALPTTELLGFSQGRLYIEGVLPPMPNLLRGEVSWLGEGNTAPRTVLTGLRAAYWVTDRAIVFSRTPLFSNRITYARSDLDGTNERAGSPASLIPGENEIPTRAGERIYYLREPDTINNDVATLDLVTGIETVVYRPNPLQDRIRFFRVGGRLIVWRPAIGADPGWIDSVDLDGNDLRRLAQSPDIMEAKPF